MYISLWIIVIGVIIYFLWIKNKKEISTSLNDKRTSLNPLFSKREVSDSQELFNNWRKIYEESFESFMKMEVEEIKKFQGKKEDFKPSQKFLDAIGKNILARFCANWAKQDYEKMIESNISIMNGEKINIVEENFYKNSKNSGVIQYKNLAIKDNWQFYWKHYGRIFQKEYEEDIKQRKNYWLGSWDSILKE